MIKIVTDSGANLPPDVIGDPDLIVCPLLVVTPQQSYKDGVDLTTEQLLDLMLRLPQIPSTSQPSAGDVEAIFRPLLEAGNEVLAVLLSSKLSGTVASAEAAAQSVDPQRVTVLDTLSVSMGQGMMAAEALKSAKRGMSVLQILERLRFMKDKMRIGFVVDSLEYMLKGGRIGKATAFLGTLLSFKPILSIKGGIVEPIDKVRTRRKAMDRLLELLASEVGTEREVNVGVVHLSAAEEAEFLRQRCTTTFRTASSYISELGAVIGVHVGPGTVGLGVCPVVPD